MGVSMITLKLEDSLEGATKVICLYKGDMFI